MYQVDSPHANDTNGDGPRPSLSDRVQSLRLSNQVAARGNPTVRLIPWFLCLLLAGAAGYFAYNSLSAEKASPTAAIEKLIAQNATGPTANAPMPQDGSIALKGKGNIIPISLIQVSPKVGGMVLELYIKEGMNVKEGDLLAVLEDTEYRSERDKVAAVAAGAKARWEEWWKYREPEIQQAKADLEDATAQAEQLHREYLRSVQLKATNALAPKEYEQAESAYRSQTFRVERLKLAYELLQKGPRDSKIAAAKAEMQQAEAELVRAQWKLDNTKVVAPITGTVLSKKTEKGNQVNPAAFSNGLSASICEMADLTKLEVEVSIAERDIAKIFTGQKCEVRAEAYMDRPYAGKVSRLMPTADRGKAAVWVRVLVEVPEVEAGQFLRPEMGAVVTFYNPSVKK